MIREILAWLLNKKTTKTFSIETVSDYLFVKYLCKAYEAMYKCNANLTGIKCSDAVRKSLVYKFDACLGGYAFEPPIYAAGEAVVVLNSDAYVRYTSELSKGVKQVSVSETDTGIKVYLGRPDLNLCLNNQGCSETLLEVYAMLCILYFKELKAVPTMDIVITSDTLVGLRLCHEYHCKTFGNRFLKAVTIQEPRLLHKDLGWEAFSYNQFMLGYWLSPTRVDIKRAAFKKLFSIGDAVYLYSLADKSQRVSVRDIDCCKLCIVSDITDTAVILLQINSMGTRVGQENAMRFANDSAGVQLYSCNDFGRCMNNEVKINFASLGVSDYLYDEDYYVMPPFEGLDVFSCSILTPKGNENLLLNSIEYGYISLKDWGVTFNEENYTKRYMSKKRVKELDAMLAYADSMKVKRHRYSDIFSKNKASEVSLGEDLFGLFFD